MPASVCESAAQQQTRSGPNRPAAAIGGGMIFWLWEFICHACRFLMSIFQSSLSNDLGFLKIMATLERYGDLIIGFLTFNMPYLPNIRSLGPPDGTEEATEIH